ncbi:52K protein [Bovine atadenovirus D]|uniref:52K protein n=1 Tax=Bovine adenovirus 4 TaxID=70333 RepID=Q997I2_ADEB4|nr:52K protein [Bovine atadenovirus D]AAK13168.1 52K protein [Bovine adenovirus 4]
MHPILQNFRSSLEDSSHAISSSGTSELIDDKNKNFNVGIASKHDEETTLRETQRNDKIPKSKIHKIDVFRDEEPKMAEERDLIYNASNHISLNLDKKLEPEMFKPDFPGTNAAQRHIEAAEVHRNGNHTRDLEQWCHDTFVSHAKQLLLRPNLSLGMTYLDDFLQTYLEHSNSSELTFQLITLLSHTTEPTLRRLLSSVSQKDSKGNFKQQWLIDLVTCLYLIIRDEQNINERLSALLTTSNHLALYFAKKASGGFYPTADKLAKTHIYFKRIILAVLALADNIGSYNRNPHCRRPLKKSKLEVEPSDDSYMFSLKGALETPESDEEEEWNKTEHQIHSGLQI